MLNIVLFEPQIPENTGNIVRTCVGLNAQLHLIRPYGFFLHSKKMQRAGLDYWQHIQLHEYDCWDAFVTAHNHLALENHLYVFSKHGQTMVHLVNWQTVLPPVFFLFGNETQGLPAFFHNHYQAQMVQLQMHPNIRCYNLANSVAMAAYYFHTQTNFTFL